MGPHTWSLLNLALSPPLSAWLGLSPSPLLSAWLGLSPSSLLSAWLGLSSLEIWQLSKQKKPMLWDIFPKLWERDLVLAPISHECQIKSILSLSLSLFAPMKGDYSQHIIIPLPKPFWSFCNRKRPLNSRDILDRLRELLKLRRFPPQWVQYCQNTICSLN